MKIIDIINRVKREEENKSEIDLGNFWEEFGMIWDFMPDPPDKMECYYLYKLDGKGGRVYFLNNEPVCISIEIGHKEKEKFEWISEVTFNKTRDYVRSLSSVPSETHVLFLDKEEDFCKRIALNYSSGYHNGTPLYHKSNGSNARVVKRFKCDNGLYTNKVEVLFCDGERIICDVNELTLKYLID